MKGDSAYMEKEEYNADNLIHETEVNVDQIDREIAKAEKDLKQHKQVVREIKRKNIPQYMKDRKDKPEALKRITFLIQRRPKDTPFKHSIVVFTHQEAVEHMIEYHHKPIHSFLQITPIKVKILREERRNCLSCAFCWNHIKESKNGNKDNYCYMYPEYKEGCEKGGTL